MMKCPGAISSLNDPTAEKAMMASTPKCFNAAMLALAGTSVGVIVCAVPCLEMNAILSPEGNSEIVMGDDGFPQG